MEFFFANIPMTCKAGAKKLLSPQCKEGTGFTGHGFVEGPKGE
jgi:hypothetical protein